MEISRGSESLSPPGSTLQFEYHFLGCPQVLKGKLITCDLPIKMSVAARWLGSQLPSTLPGRGLAGRLRRGYTGCRHQPSLCSRQLCIDPAMTPGRADCPVPRRGPLQDEERSIHPAGIPHPLRAPRSPAPPNPDPQFSPNSQVRSLRSPISKLRKRAQRGEGSHLMSQCKDVTESVPEPKLI